MIKIINDYSRGICSFDDMFDFGFTDYYRFKTEVLNYLYCRGVDEVKLDYICENDMLNGDYLRKHEHRCCSVEEISEAEDSFQAPPPGDDVHQEARRLHHCMDHLPAEQRQSIALAYYRGLSQTEIALSMNQPEGTVKSWIRRALTHLRECIGL